MDNCEKIISNVLSKEIYIPQQIENTIKNCLFQIKVLSLHINHFNQN